MSTAEVDLNDPEFIEFVAKKYASDADVARFAPMLRAEIEKAKFEPDYKAWLANIFPTFARAPLGPHHEEFWQWVYDIQPDKRPDAFIAIWNRGGAKSSSAEMACVNLAALGKRKYVLYVCRTQEQADDHVGTIAAMLESDSIANYYPGLSKRKVGKFGNAQGWRRNRLRTESGFTIDALGLDSSKRGAKIEDQRPDVIVFDDIDKSEDSPKVTRKLVSLITNAILPAGTTNTAVMFVQNLIHANGVAAKLLNGQADYLRRRKLSGPIPALRNFSYQQNEDGTYTITSGEPTWAGYDQQRCEEDLNEYGPKAFRQEAQHDVSRIDGTFWVREQIDINRVATYPDLERVVVAVDPSGGDDEDNDEQGIIVVGRGIDGKAYVLDDATCKLKPAGWGGRVIGMYDKWMADKVVGERNFGGDMVQNTIRGLSSEINYDDVHAARGKEARIEPVAPLYGDVERPDEWHISKVRHVGDFPELEEEMTTWFKGCGWSPNRLDALVWALTELFNLDKAEKKRPRATFRG